MEQVYLAKDEMQVPAFSPEFEAVRTDTIRQLALLDQGEVPAFDSIISLTQLAADVPISAFSVIHDERQTFKARIGLEVPSTPREHAFCAWTICQEHDSMIFTVEDARAHPAFTANPLVNEPPNIRFYAGITILAPNRIPIGTLFVVDSLPRRLTAIIEQALRSGKVMLENTLLLQHEAVHEHLTGLYSRRFFDKMFEKELRRSLRDRLPLSIMLMDVDFFKTYNDTYGHTQGDEVLRSMGTLLSKHVVRAGDLVARYGGEEFVFVLPSTDKNGAKLLAERLMSELGKLNIEHASSPYGKLTVSLGIGIVTEKATAARGAEPLLSLVDELLYRAKNTGRNQIVIDTL